MSERNARLCAQWVLTGFLLLCTVNLEGWAVHCENGPFPCWAMTVWILESDNLLSFLVNEKRIWLFFHEAAFKERSDGGRRMKKTIRFVWVNQKTQKVVWRENPNSHWEARKWSIFTVNCSTFQVNSANKAENPSKLIKHRAVHFFCE